MIGAIEVHAPTWQQPCFDLDGYPLGGHEAVVTALRLVGLEDVVTYGQTYKVTLLCIGGGPTFAGSPISGEPPRRKDRLVALECLSLERVDAPDLPGLENLRFARRDEE